MAVAVEMGRRLAVLIDADNVSAAVVSSDSDFTRLASRIREQGVPVYGFGESKTPRPFIAACDRFVFTDVLTGSGSGDTARRAPLKNLKGDGALVDLLRKVVDDSADETGWAHRGEVGSRLVKQEPDFDPRNYGFPRLRPLIEAVDLFKLEERPGPQGHKPLWLRDKRKKASK
jgi:uncharacterized LabA/DUF88 family protein